MTNLIKNYLPLRINLPCQLDPSLSEETFAFVKPHLASSSFSSSSRTLFLSNVPFFPNVKTSILLQALFERFGDVEKVVVTHHPKKDFEDDGNMQYGSVTDEVNSFEDMTVSMFKKEIRSLTGQQDGMTLDEYSWYNEGKFAHIVFSTPKMMKEVWNILQKNNEDGITIGKLEIQELEDVSFLKYQKAKDRFCKRNTQTFEKDETRDSDDEEEEEEKSKIKERGRGISNLVEAKKTSIPSRETLKMVCDQIMAKHEEAEEEAICQKEAAKDQPDDDGFVTVTYGTNVGDVVDMEEKGTLGNTGTAGGRKHKEDMKRGRTRNRSARPNVVKGNSKLPDFYRFQLKESKKRSMEDLKNRFQEDLKRVKKMKEEKMYRPF